MKIIFGLDLDGYQDLRTGDRFNELICGPKGFLGLLELRLGLPSKPVSAAVRVAQYRSLLENAASNKSRFYSTSFSKNAFSAAETLLQWRDELILAGWDGSAGRTDSPRIRDLADVEELANETLSPGFPGRVRAALAELDRRKPKLDGVEVVDDPKHVPRLLRKLLIKIGASFSHGHGSTPKPAAASGTDLRKIQEALANCGRQGQVKLTYDGSVVFVTAYSEVTLAHLAAQTLQKSRQQKLSAAIIGQSNCSHLEVTLRGIDEPVFALSVRSAARPVLQTLALALALRWSPLDPRDLLAFLVHPVSPMSDRLRHKLAGIVAERPGLSGSEWKKGIDEHRAFLRKKFAADTAALRKARERSDGDLTRWVTVGRFDPLSGAPGSELALTCAAIASWATATTKSEELSPAMLEQYAQLASHASDLATISKSLSCVTRAQLELLLEQLVGKGIQCEHTVAEACHVARLHTPASLLEPLDTLLWWDFRGAGFSQRAPWTRAEIKGLEQSGVELPSATACYARENRAALRAVLAVKKHLIFMCPRVIGNELVPHHPLRDRIQALVDCKLAELDLDQHLGDPVAVPAPGSVAPRLRIFSRRQLPGIRRWWKLSNGQYLGPRDFESFTSAEKFIFRPYDWVLKYKAQLRSGLLFGNQIVHASRQRGNLLHRFSELVFSASSSIQWMTLSREQVCQWLEIEWQKLLPAEGANLLLPGNRAQADSLLAEGKRAIWSLIEHLHAASVTKTEINFSPEPALFVGGKLQGWIDLLAENSGGRKGIIDLKYNGYTGKKEELTNNLQLQLAIYGYLIASGAAWPGSAFFILNKRAMLTQDTNFFPGAEIVSSKASCSGLQGCWKEFETVWKWRRELLDQGWIESNIEGASPADSSPSSSMPPIERWLAEPSAGFNDFDALIGWKEDA